MTKYGVLVLAAVSFCSYAQKVTLDPTITPSLFRYNDQITITYDATGTSLASLPNAWIWVWIPNTNINAKYNFNPANSNTAQTDNAKFTKSVVNGKTLFIITFRPSDFFASDISAQETLGILLKGNDWPNGQTTDYLVDFWDGGFQVQLVSPTEQPLFVNTGNEIAIQAETPVTADFSFFVNDVLIDTQNDITSFFYTHSVTETTGYSTLKIVATAGENSDEISFQYLLSVGSPSQTRPPGIVAGINYHDSDDTKVTLCLWAPGKTSVYAFGDFSDWQVLPQNLMKREGEFFWIELANLNPNQEYAFQYLVDESLKIADPYADKILDPDDQYIPAAAYPNLKAFPEKALSEQWYYNRLAVFQTGQASYQWQVSNFQKPAKEKLVIYELLIRDFFGSNDRYYQNLIDTLSYFNRLGINAIELMPVMEFNGNESWGYNPTFLFAPDKYYGSKNKLKEFIDKCHQNGIAVILDMVMNHHDLPNPYVMMDFDFVNYKPTASNKWFNVSATHPFNVFYDMNHESAYTKKYLDTVNYYWLKEYKADGFRYDLSKGFTQSNNPDKVSTWSAYDASRISLLKRMADKIWEHTPDAYIILEHLGANEEEKELAEYRADEGKGMMLWGKMTDAYNQCTMGYSENSDINWIYHASRGWSTPGLVGYMESHDEERLMYKNIQFGNVSGAYNVKDLNTGLSRVIAASTLFYTIPGPKMLWQFGELGYDYSINYCENGTISSDCRISPKPVEWDYQEDPIRNQLFDHVRDLIRLRNSYDVFSKGTAAITTGTDLVKHLELKGNPYVSNPANANEMNVVVVANFDVISKNVSVSFPHSGTWYDYYRGSESLQVSNTSASLTLEAGEYKLFTDFPIESSVVTAIESQAQQKIVLYPNPASDKLMVKTAGVTRLSVVTVQGKKITLQKLPDSAWDVSDLSPGLYVVEVVIENKTFRSKLIKR